MAGAGARVVFGVERVVDVLRGLEVVGLRVGAAVARVALPEVAGGAAAVGAVGGAVVSGGTIVSGG